MQNRPTMGTAAEDLLCQETQVANMKSCKASCLLQNQARDLGKGRTCLANSVGTGLVKDYPRTETEPSASISSSFDSMVVNDVFSS